MEPPLLPHGTMTHSSPSPALALWWDKPKTDQKETELVQQQPKISVLFFLIFFFFLIRGTHCVIKTASGVRSGGGKKKRKKKLPQASFEPLQICQIFFASSKVLEQVKARCDSPLFSICLAPLSVKSGYYVPCLFGAEEVSNRET